MDRRFNPQHISSVTYGKQSTVRHLLHLYTVLLWCNSFLFSLPSYWNESICSFLSHFPHRPSLFVPSGFFLDRPSPPHFLPLITSAITIIISTLRPHPYLGWEINSKWGSWSAAFCFDRHRVCVGRAAELVRICLPSHTPSPTTCFSLSLSCTSLSLTLLASRAELRKVCQTHKLPETLRLCACAEQTAPLIPELQLACHSWVFIRWVCHVRMAEMIRGDKLTAVSYVFFWISWDHVCDVWVKHQWDLLCLIVKDSEEQVAVEGMTCSAEARLGSNPGGCAEDSAMAQRPRPL